MYLDFYQLKIKPFQITADPKFLWLGEKHKEALATLRYGIVDNRGFLLLTGEVGTGKTLLINRLTTLLDIDTVVATLPDPDLESMDFYNLLADGLNMKRIFESKGAFLIHLRDFLHQSYAKQQQVLLIIDESQRLNPKLMEDIRVLSNIELHDRKLINIFFVGQQEFNSILMTPQNRALAQRITVRYHIEALNANETGEYVKHRLTVAGSKTPIFKKMALREIYHFSGGIPRLINIISDHALLTGYAQGAKQIDADMIKECAAELRIPIQKPATDAATLRSAPNKQNLAENKILSPANKISEQQLPPKLEPAPRKKPSEEKEQPAAWKLANVLMVLLLMAVVVYAINQFSGGETTQYDETELTPKKYKTTLEKEKELLSNRLEQSTSSEATDETNDSGTSGAAADTSNTSAGPQDVEPEDPEPTASPVPDQQERDAAEPEEGNTAEPEEGHSNLSAQATQTAPVEINQEEEQRVEIEPLPLMEETIVIQFAVNSNEIASQSYVLLDRVAAYLVQHPEKSVFVRGYTDSSGSRGYNDSVSRFRASVVKTYLIGKGAFPEKIEVFAMGAANPVASNDTLAGRRQNRRVEIEFGDESNDTQ